MTSRFWTRKNFTSDKPDLLTNRRGQTEIETPKIKEEEKHTKKNGPMNSSSDVGKSDPENNITVNRSSPQGLGIMVNNDSFLPTNSSETPHSGHRNTQLSTDLGQSAPSIKSVNSFSSERPMGRKQRSYDSNYHYQAQPPKKTNASSRLISSMISLDSTPIIPNAIGFDTFGVLDASEFLLDPANSSIDRANRPSSPGASYKWKVKKQYLDNMKSGNPRCEANLASSKRKHSSRIDSSVYSRYQHNSPLSSPAIPHASSPRVQQLGDGLKLTDSTLSSNLYRKINGQNKNSFYEKHNDNSPFSTRSTSYTSSISPLLGARSPGVSSFESRSATDFSSYSRSDISPIIPTNGSPSRPNQKTFTRPGELETSSANGINLENSNENFDTKLPSPNLSFAAAATARIFGTQPSDSNIAPNFFEYKNNEAKTNNQNSGVLAIGDMGIDSATQKLMKEIRMVKYQIELSNKRQLALLGLNNDEEPNIPNLSALSLEQVPTLHFELELSCQKDINDDICKLRNESVVSTKALEVLSLKNLNLRQEYDGLLIMTDSLNLPIDSSDETQRILIDKLNTEFDTLTLQNSNLLSKLDEIHYNILPFSFHKALAFNNTYEKELENSQFKSVTSPENTVKTKDKPSQHLPKSDTIEKLRTQRDLLKSSFLQLKLLNTYRTGIYNDYCENNLFMELKKLRNINEVLRNQYLSLVDSKNVSQHWRKNKYYSDTKLDQEVNGEPLVIFKRLHSKSEADKSLLRRHKKSRNFSPSGIAISSSENSIKSANQRYSLVMKSKKKIELKTPRDSTIINKTATTSDKLINDSQEELRAPCNSDVEYLRKNVKQSKEFLPLRAATKDGMLMQE